MSRTRLDISPTRRERYLPPSIVIRDSRFHFHPPSTPSCGGGSLAVLGTLPLATVQLWVRLLKAASQRNMTSMIPRVYEGETINEGPYWD